MPFQNFIAGSANVHRLLVLHRELTSTVLGHPAKNGFTLYFVC
jgi:hypothetical protein